MNYQKRYLRRHHAGLCAAAALPAAPAATHADLLVLVVNFGDQRFQFSGMMNPASPFMAHIAVQEAGHRENQSKAS